MVQWVYEIGLPFQFALGVRGGVVGNFFMLSCRSCKLLIFVASLSIQLTSVFNFTYIFEVIQRWSAPFTFTHPRRLGVISRVLLARLFRPFFAHLPVLVEGSNHCEAQTFTVLAGSLAVAEFANLYIYIPVGNSIALHRNTHQSEYWLETQWAAMECDRMQKENNCK